MTESAWLSTTTTAPLTMLRRVQRKLSRRKQQLIACGCCRLVWDQLDHAMRAAVVGAERYADGAISDRQFAAVREMANVAIGDTAGVGVAVTERSAALVAAATHDDLSAGLPRAVEWAVHHPVFDGGGRQPGRQVCGLIREVVGNPFRKWVIQPAFLGGGLVQPDGRVVRLTEAVAGLAEAAYADQRFDALPVLADAAEEAGVDDPDLLAHLRGPGPHARGCWAVDLLAGRG